MHESLLAWVDACMGFVFVKFAFCMRQFPVVGSLLDFCLSFVYLCLGYIINMHESAQVSVDINTHENFRLFSCSFDLCI